VKTPLSRGTLNLKCEYCGKELNKRQKKYCSNKCQLEKQQEDWEIRWKQGLESGIRGEYGISSHIRTYLLKKYSNKCSSCGWGEKNPYTNTIPLEVNHIDGNYQNNTEENLNLLCPNCHSLTINYKKANENGRSTRKKYYFKHANPEQGESRV